MRRKEIDPIEEKKNKRILCVITIFGFITTFVFLSRVFGGNFYENQMGYLGIFIFSILFSPLAGVLLLIGFVVMTGPIKIFIIDPIKERFAVWKRKRDY